MIAVIQPEELIAIQDPGLVLIDVSNGKDASGNYLRKHLQGALFADLNTQLASLGPTASEGGRHPLPSPAKFSRTLGSLGITPGSHVVLYDDKGGSNAAARFWWMLRAAGHTRVQVLDGGLQEAEKTGIPVQSGTAPVPQQTVYSVTEWLWPVAGTEAVEVASQNEEACIIDVRDRDRYLGITEPLDPVAGHIPSAINMPFRDNLQPDGRFKTPEELKALYKPVFAPYHPSDIIVHCGSGVTACHTLLAMDYAGLPLPKLYPGSWSAWCRSGKPVV